MQRRLPAGGGNRAYAAFQCGNALFENRVGRVADAAIDVAGALKVKQGGGLVTGLEHKGGGQVDGHCARAGRIGHGTGVQGKGVKAGVGISAHKRFSRVLQGGRHATGSPYCAAIKAAIVGYIRRVVCRCSLRTDGQMKGSTMKVSDILRVKGGTLFTATPDERLAQAVQMMSDYDIGSLVVMEHGDLVGMLTFREVIQSIVKNQGLGSTLVRSAMDDAPLTCTMETEMDEVRRMMLDRHARYMPVMDKRMLMGVISFYDVAKAVVDSQNFENKMLQAYIRDWPGQEEGATPAN